MYYHAKNGVSRLKNDRVMAVYRKMSQFLSCETLCPVTPKDKNSHPYLLKLLKVGGLMSQDQVRQCIPPP